MTEKKKSGFEALASKTSLYPQEQLLAVKKHKNSFFIGLPREVSLQENRLSLTPDAVALLVAIGWLREYDRVDEKSHKDIVKVT